MAPSVLPAPTILKVSRSPIPVLTAPTASGKTALSLRLALDYGLEIVAADAFTVYRGLDLGTAKPSAQERAAAPHHLLDVVDVTERYDVARYVQDAEAALSAILARGGRPLVVGGTGFYLAALIRGLPTTPPGVSEVRAAIEARLAERGLDTLLALLPPDEAARAQRNPRRVVRALEIYTISGQWPAAFSCTPPAHHYALTAFTPAPAVHGETIAARTHHQLQAGWPQEAAWLAAQVSPSAQPRPTVWQALGYAQAYAVSQGQLTPEAAASQIITATRQYARRQQTFLRGQLGAEILTPADAEAQLRAALLRARPLPRARLTP